VDVSTVSQGPDGGPARRAHRWSRVLAVRACRRALLGGVVAFAFVGALTSPPYVVLMVAPAFGIFIASMVAMINPAFPEARSARRATVMSGTSAALVVPCLAGIVQFGAAGAVTAVVLMVLGCVVVGGWIAEQSDPPGRGAASDLDVEELRQFLQVLPTSMLLREWRSAGEHVQPGADPDRRAGAVLVRTVLLEELSRRDPVGVARWLSEGDEDAPEQYLRGDSDATT
jgi:hypothetical protein